VKNHEADFQPQELQPEPTPLSTGAGTNRMPSPTPTIKSNGNVFIILSIVVLVGLCVISACVGISGLIGAGVFKVITEKPKVESVIDEYLTAMDSQDAGKAYTLLSPRVKRIISLDDVEYLLEGNHYAVFEGYQSIAFTNFSLTMTYDYDPDMPQGLVAEVDGMISYADGFTGDFTAVLEQDGEEWRLYSINVNAPVEKFGP
jgi:hypothetical protein